MNAALHAPAAASAQAREPAMKILLIDDHDLVRYGLRRLLTELVPEAEILEAASLQGGAGVYAERKGAIDLVVLDLNLPDARGLAGLRRFLRGHPGVRLVVLSGTLDEAIAMEATAAGALAFLHKASDCRTLRAQMMAFLSGLAAPAPLPPKPAAAAHACRASLREIDLRVLDLLLQGLSNREIAEVVGIAIGTAKNHISGLFAAFGVTSRARLIALFH